MYVSAAGRGAQEPSREEAVASYLSGDGGGKNQNPRFTAPDGGSYQRPLMKINTKVLPYAALAIVALLAKGYLIYDRGRGGPEYFQTPPPEPRVHTTAPAPAAPPPAATPAPMTAAEHEAQEELEGDRVTRLESQLRATQTCLVSHQADLAEPLTAALATPLEAHGIALICKEQRILQSLLVLCGGDVLLLMEVCAANAAP